MTGGSSRPAVSVVVPTCDRPALLARCVRALLEQDLEGRPFEVIVVDDGRTEGAERVVEAAVAGSNGGGDAAIRLVRTFRPRLGPAAARNLGWRTARAPVIAFTDDDCIPSPDWLRSGLHAMKEGIAGASGRIVMPLGPAPTDYEADAARLEEGVFATANCFYRTEKLKAVGGFDERFTSAWREDSDLYFTLLERGERLVRAPDAVVVHPVRKASWGVSIRQQEKSRFEPLLYQKHPALYRRHIQPRPRWIYYAATGCLLAAILGGAGRRPRLSAAAAGAWAALTASFCSARLRGTSRKPGHVIEMAVTSALIPPLSLFWRLVGAARFRAFVP